MLCVMIRIFYDCYGLLDFTLHSEEFYFQFQFLIFGVNERCMRLMVAMDANECFHDQAHASSATLALAIMVFTGLYHIRHDCFKAVLVFTMGTQPLNHRTGAILTDSRALLPILASIPPAHHATVFLERQALC